MANPENSGYIQPFTLGERWLHVRESERTLDSRFPWICDSMQNNLKYALGVAPNSEFVLDSERRVIRNRSWSNSALLRKELEESIGAVERPTSVADLELKMQPPPIIAACGTVERVERIPNRQANWVEPDFKAKDNPFHAKLRAEAEPSLIRSEAGKLYLGFHLNPRYGVHWNIVTKPIRVRLSAPDGTNLISSMAEGPKVHEPTDIDPREFLIHVTNWPIETPIKVTVNCFACIDEQGWCLSLQQRDDLIRVRDSEAGWIHRNRGGARDRATQSRSAPLQNDE